MCTCACACAYIDVQGVVLCARRSSHDKEVCGVRVVAERGSTYGEGQLERSLAQPQKCKRTNGTFFVSFDLSFGPMDPCHGMTTTLVFSQGKDKCVCRSRHDEHGIT